MDPLPAAQAPQSVADIMAICGLPNAPPANQNVPTIAAYVASEIFLDTFEKCLDMSSEDLKRDLKTLGENPMAPIFITASIRTKIQAFVEWAKQCIRCGFDPATTVFPVDSSVDLIRQGSVHADFINKAKLMAATAKPPQFKPSDDWANWSPLVVNYFRQLPGRDGVPLSYVIRDNEQAFYDPNENDIQQKYIQAVPLDGPTFQADSLQVHTYIANLIAGNVKAEAAIQRYRRQECGRADWQALKAVFEGTGAFSVDKVNATRILETLFYSGEKGRDHNWSTFQQKLLKAFTTFEIHSPTNVVMHDNETKIKILLKKTASCSFLQQTAALIRRDLAYPNCNGLTFEQALAQMQNDVTTFAGSSSNYNHPNNRRIQNTNSSRNENRGHPYGGRSGRGGRSTNGGRGGHGRGGRGRGNGTRNHPDAYMITLTNGRRLSVHPSYKFTDEEMTLMHPNDKKAIFDKRAAYNAARQANQNRNISAATQVPLTFNIPPNADAATVISAVTTQLNQAQQQQPAQDSYSITISQARSDHTTNHTPFGGRNEEAARRGNRHIAHLYTVRHDSPDTRQIKSTYQVSHPSPNVTAANECDSNADTCCVGTNFSVIQFTNRYADVYPYDASYAPIKNVPIVSAGTAWTDPDTDETFILVMHECLYYGTSLPHTLWNPNQLRHNGVIVNDNPYDDSPNRMCIDVDDLRIPLHSNGTKIQFFSRSPTEHELLHCRHIELTNINTWNPKTVTLGAVVSQPATIPYCEPVISPFVSDSLLFDVSPGLVNLKERALHHVIISSASTMPEGTTNEGTTNEGTLPEPVLGFTDIPARRTFQSNERHLTVSAENLAELWNLGQKQSEATLRCTYQRGTRSAILPLHRRYRVDRQIGLNRLSSNFATDTVYADIPSLENFKYAQVYTNKNGFSAVYPMKRITGDEIGETLKDFANEFGIPDHLTYDRAAAQVGRGTLFQKMIRTYDIQTHSSEKERPNENPAEGGIRQLKMKWYRAMHKRKVPPRLWNYGLKWVSEIGNVTANSSKYSRGRTPLEIITGETPDISEYLDFGFYDYCSFLSNAGLGAPKLGRWLGVSHRVGKLMSYWVLPESGIPISCTTVQRVTNLELQTDEYKARIMEYEAKIAKRMEVGEPIEIPSHVPVDCQLGLLEYESQAFLDEFQRVIDNPEIPHGADDNTEALAQNGNYAGMKLSMKRSSDGKVVAAKIRGPATDDNGTPLGTMNDNPLLDMTQYVVDYIDGQSEVVTANIIAENILSQTDDYGYGRRQLDEIIDHRTTEDAVPIHEGWVTTNTGSRRRRITTKGWEIYLKWTDGSTDWVALKDLKNTYPVELAEYAVRKKIHHMPAFAFWVPYTLKKRDAIIKKLKTKYWERTHKYGIKIPKSMKEAIAFDTENGNTLWYDAIMKEMKNVRIAFQEYSGKVEDLKKAGYEQITCHIIFDVKLSEGFRRKARFVADGHKVETPPSVSYSSVVARDSVRICLMLAALNDLNVLCVDIQNAYLTAPNKEKVFMKAGMEFGDECGKWMLIVRALYGLRGAGASFRSFLASKLDEMGFSPCVADPDVWMRAATKPNGDEYYEYMLCYVDDILCVSHKAEATLKELGQSFKFKNDEIKEPSMYLGATLKKRTLNGKERWSITSDEYLKAAVENLENQLKQKNKTLPKPLSTPTNLNVIFELDDSRLLDPDEIVHYQELIGILRWATELGRIDILLEVSLLSSYSAMPRWNHLMQVYQIFAFLKSSPRFSLYMSPEFPAYETMKTERCTENFLEHYRDAKEVLPTKMPKPRGNRAVISAYVDASHAGNKVTRHSHTGIQIFVNRALVMWYSKKQPTVESSAFASEYTALKTCIEMIVGLRFKLRMLGVPIDDEPSKVFCDNQAVVLNTSEFSSTLAKKHNSVAYHMARWHVAARIIEVYWVETNQNLADAFTKRLSKHKRDELFGNISYY